MGARISVKAIVMQDNRILLNRCEDENGVYYTLPGGGQALYESLEDTVIREVQEETGYTVKPLRFAGLYEEIFSDPFLRKHYPDYTHRLYHIFVCARTDAIRMEPTETDMSQKGCEWVLLSALSETRVLPEAVAVQLPALLSGQGALFLGTGYTDKNHG